ncbi:hypothetical protein [Mucilaginibacter psychrotolerans]|uniref:Uncharacterized protein n=1 Tax=Mucilaginibacter psychrotolerans TaxID=1524096 RepID=A0A4Y8SD80_9SPHI|nr:hypothetical protein [Mucilaginibacter psychrotolerans]TFF36316.1 hypothetical protein E2R66_15890 [Mucilaginibacter psychrotolerans]
MKPNASLFFGFSAFGLLIGSIAGITSAPVTNTILVSLFALIGGKTLFDSIKQGADIQKKVGLILSGLSIFCLVGFTLGISIKVNRSFTQSPIRHSPIDTLTYLRNHETDIIESKWRNGEITGDSAMKLIIKYKENEN